MKHNFFTYSDGVNSQRLPDVVKRELSTYAGAVDAQTGRVSFCGFVFNKNEVHIFMPKGSKKELTPREILLRARSLYSVFQKYFRYESANISVDALATVVGAPQILPLIQEIVDDYLINGLYVDSSHYESSGLVGKPDWQKTIKNITPVILGKKIIYPNFINRLPNHQLKTEISRIHSIILSEISKDFGWLFPNFSYVGEHDGLSVGVERDIYLLRNELRHTHSDRKVTLLKNLLGFLQKNSYRNASGVSAVGFVDFHWVWESMLRDVLGPTKKIQMPIPAYKNQVGEVSPVPRKGQRVDIFLFNELTKSAVVIDAKYYLATSSTNSPGWPDLVKQFFYAKSLLANKKNNPVEKVKNYFVFPGAASTDSPALACVLSSDYLRLDDEFPPVECIHVPPELVMEAFIAGKTLTHLRNNLLA